MRLKALLLPALIALTLGLAACGSDDDETTGATNETPPAETTEGAAGEEGATEEPGGVSAEPGGSTPAPSGEARRAEKVEIVEFTYQPDPVVVQAGGKVTWQNEDMAPHTATADDGSFDTGTLEQGKLESETFKQAGTFSYFCEIHPDMKGTVEVVDAE